ncbi:MAG: indolepyruvate ferredoxin oxidoreductase family protein [Myxococcota bacterium]
MKSGQAIYDESYSLDHRYTRESGRVYLNGVQALTRLPLMQRRRDHRAGLNTAGFISGYRGSPLGTFDLALWQAKAHLDAHHIHFEPGVNEDLAATAVWGSQQVNLLEGARYDGVFAMWYGKGPGVDRSCDALKHGNHAGSAPKGGVLVLTGDDPAARSSSIAHQSEPALVHCGIPVLNPADLQDYLDLGLYGFAMSRYAGCWVGFKCLTDSVDSSASVEVGPERVQIALPDDFEMPAGGLHIGWSNLPLEVERRLFQFRLGAAQAFVRANGLDRTVLGGGSRRLGIVTTGKTYLDLRQALDELGIDEERAAELGLSIYKVAMSWPLEPEGARRFAAGLKHLLVVEEKRPLIEDQLARLLYNLDERPRLCGKHDEQGGALISSQGELSPGEVAQAVRSWLEGRVPGVAKLLSPPRSAGDATASVAPGSLKRLPSFCSGCPHNTSTVVPEGSVAMGGIGCHGMAVWLPERRTLAVSQMGGEGATWIGQAPFTETPHIFQNMGDGTYFHSGLLAIRAAVTAGVNITYKILVNGGVAMTGGQPIEGEPLEGEVTVPEIARQLDAEGVGRIAVVSDAPDKYPRGSGFPAQTSFHDRAELDRVQRELRQVPGVSAIVYDQICAAEARRLRKRGAFPDPDLRIVINERVCEGCGDCSVQSNCISIEPVETEFGRKRRINQSSCNKDYSCLRGYCPSFVSVRGGTLRQPRRETPEADVFALLTDLPAPAVADCARPFETLVTGIGGSGVVTVGALLGMAAHLEGKGCSVLDVTGLAQKNGPVTSHIRIAERSQDLYATRIAVGAADLVLGCDIVVASGAEALSKMAKGRTTALVNCHVAPTFEFAINPDLDLSSQGMEEAIRRAVGDEDAHFLQATQLATALLGDSVATNLFLVGYALQRGRLPVGLGALERAIELNGRAVEMNKRAVAWGRLAAHDLAAVEEAARPHQWSSDFPPATETLDELVARRMVFLSAYQNAAYAQRYEALVERSAARERELGIDQGALASAVARYYFKLLAYKDEYEVARLYSDGEFRRQLDNQFEGDFKLHLQLAPQFLNRRDPDTGRARKVSLGAWVFPLLGLLARFKFLRGTPFDLFGWTAHRRRERALIDEYELTLDELLAGLSTENHALAVEIASLPELIRGYDLVKEDSICTAQEKKMELQRAFRLRAPADAARPMG